ETGADRFKIVNELTRLEVGRPIECHVFEQVRQAALIVGFVYRTSLDDQAHRRASLWLRVAANEERQSVRQRARTNGRVERERRRQILRCGGGGAQDQRQQV